MKNGLRKKFKYLKVILSSWMECLLGVIFHSLEKTHALGFSKFKFQNLKQST